MKILETNRFYLRELNPDDAESFYLLNEDEEVIKYTGDKPFKSINDARSFLENYNQYKKYGVGRWAVIEKSTNTFLGWSGLKYTVELKEYDIGFRFFRKYWNKGIATETSKACIDFGFDILGIDEIVGRVMNKNIASIKVLQKIGFKSHKPFDFEGNEGQVLIIRNV